ncbi:MAG: hypothetical protein K6G88_08310 [Lachnospiraceae bacterium]|nr:hypothetical protein [Lachnospiraceae bacterium]
MIKFEKYFRMYVDFLRTKEGLLTSVIVFIIIHFFKKELMSASSLFSLVFFLLNISVIFSMLYSFYYLIMRRLGR